MALLLTSGDVMFGLGLTELLIIGALVVLLLGPATSRRLFTRARTLWTDFRRLRVAARNPLSHLTRPKNDPPR
jgi:Sec-independent protein translocase protein TatA